MQSIQIRLGKEELAELSALQDEFKRSRSEVTRRALAEGIRVLKMDVALNRYAREEITLQRAAEFAGVSIAQMADAAAARGIAYFRYTAEELESDVRTLRRGRK
jgi:predicted HTH domain antitoxin